MPTINRIPFHDFEALKDVIQDSQSDVMQLGTGRMRGLISHLALNPGFGISTGRFTVAMRARGVLSRARWCLGIVLATDGPVLGHRHEFGAGDLIISTPNEDRYIRFTNNTEYMAVLIDPEQVQAFLATQEGVYERLLQHEMSVLHATPAQAKATLDHLRPLLDAVSDLTLTDHTIEFYKRNIMQLLTAPLRNISRFREAHLASQERLVRDGDDYLEQIGPRPVHISELCERFHVHERTLHRAYGDVLGMGPITYLRRRRLNDVHTELRRNGRDMTVQGVAKDHGFLDLGRFARAYSVMFGEKPSHTLRRAIHGVITVVCLHCVSHHATRIMAVCDTYFI